MDKLAKCVAVCCLGALAIYATTPLPSPEPVARRPLIPVLPVAKTGKLLLFTKAGCAPCAQMKAEIAALRAAGELQEWDYQEISDAARIRANRITAFPTLVAKRGLTSEVGRIVGYKPAHELRSWLKERAPAQLVTDLENRIQASVGGPIAPDGVTEIQCDLPGDFHRKNISSQGQGCCVQTSIGMAARYQNVPALIDFQLWVKEKGLTGGAAPSTVDNRIPRCAKDRGFPVPEYVQMQNVDVATLIPISKSGRFINCTYSKSPTGRYGGARIAHMVCMPHCDEKFIAILDNNYPGPDKYEWLSHDEAKRAGCFEWVVVLCNPGPPMPPRN